MLLSPLALAMYQEVSPKMPELERVSAAGPESPLTTSAIDPRGQKRSLAVIECPKSMVGRVIGKNGETIRSLQSFSGALIQINQTVDPTQVTISGTSESLSLAVSMVQGFALLRQVAGSGAAAPRASPMVKYPAAQKLQTKPLYAPGYGLIPPSQLYGAEGSTAGSSSEDVRQNVQAPGMLQMSQSQQPGWLQPGAKGMFGLQPQQAAFGSKQMTGPSVMNPFGAGGLMYSMPTEFFHCDPHMLYQPTAMAGASGYPIMSSGVRLMQTAAGVAGGRPSSEAASAANLWHPQMMMAVGNNNLVSDLLMNGGSGSPPVGSVLEGRSSLGINGSGSSNVATSSGLVQVMDTDGKVYYYSSNP